MEDYVILPGIFRGYMFVGEVPRGHIDSSTPKHLVYDEIKERQKRAHRDFERWIRDGEGTYKTLYCYCGEFCGITPGAGDGFESKVED